MIEQTLIYGLVCIADQWQTVNNANIATMDEDAILLNFDTDEQRQQYVDSHHISISIPAAQGV